MINLYYVVAPGFGYRHIQVLLLFSGLAIGYSLRVNLSVGIVAMTTNDGNKGEVNDMNYEQTNIAIKFLYLLAHRCTTGMNRPKVSSLAASSGATFYHKYLLVNWPYTMDQN